MKKTILSLIVFTFFVNASGNVGIGKNPQYKVIKQIPLSATGGKESITIHGGSMPAGVYLYSLICDGKVVDTKRMVLMK